jgi:excisionase family DNA binding protein
MKKLSTERPTINAREAADLLGVHPQTVYQLVRDGRVPVVRLPSSRAGAGGRRPLRRAMEAWIDQRRRSAHENAANLLREPFAKGGYRTVYLAERDRRLQLSRTSYVPPLLIAYAAAGGGDVEGALEYLERATTRGLATSPWSTSTPGSRTSTRTPASSTSCAGLVSIRWRGAEARFPRGQRPGKALVARSMQADAEADRARGS